MAKKRIKVLLVDDHEMARQGLRRMLELERDLEVVGEASSAEEALKMVFVLSPDIVLMDIQMPNTNGLETTRQLKEKGLRGEIIILSLFDSYLAQAIEAGAGGYLTKDVKREDLANAIRRVHQGEMVLAQDLLTSPNLVEPALQRFREMVRRRRAEGASSPPTSTPEPRATSPFPGEARAPALPQEDLEGSPQRTQQPAAATVAPPLEMADRFVAVGESLMLLTPPRTEDALRQFWRALEMNPEHAAAKQWVNRLQGVATQR